MSEKVHPFQPYMVEITVYDLAEFDGSEKTEPRHVHSRRIQFDNKYIMNKLMDEAGEIADIIKGDAAITEYRGRVGHDAIVDCVKNGKVCDKCRKLFKLEEKIG